MQLRRYVGRDAGISLKHCAQLKGLGHTTPQCCFHDLAKSSVQYGANKSPFPASRHEGSSAGQESVRRVFSGRDAEHSVFARRAPQRSSSTVPAVKGRSRSQSPSVETHTARTLQKSTKNQAVGDPRRARVDHWRYKLNKSREVRNSSKLQKNVVEDDQTWWRMFQHLQRMTVSTSQLLDAREVGRDDTTFASRLSQRQKEEVRLFVSSLLVTKQNVSLDVKVTAVQSHLKISSMWTKAMFAYAVYKIVTFNPPRLHRQTVRISNEWHHRLVAQKLNYLFGLTEFHQAVSEQAFTETIKFLLDTRQLPLARNILAKMEWFGLSPTVGIFNRFFHSCAINQNSLAFQNYLQKMDVAKVTPNWKTWIAFLFLTRDIDLRKAVIQYMDSLNFFANPIARARVAAAIVPDYFGAYIADGGRANSFITSLDAVLGSQWLTPHLSTYLFWELGKHGRILEGAMLMTQLCARGLRPSSRWLTQLIYHSRHHKNIVTSIWLIKHAQTVPLRIDLDADTYTHLFATAWNLRLANLAHTIYIYACLSGHVSVSMENQLRTELPKGRGSTGGTARQFRREFIRIGLGAFQLRDAPRLQLVPLFQRGDPEQVMLRDFRDAVHLEAVRPLHGMLVVALRRDMRWRRQGVRIGKGVSWKAVHMLRVPLRLKSGKDKLGARFSSALGASRSCAVHAHHRRRRLRGRCRQRLKGKHRAPVPLSWKKKQKQSRAMKRRFTRRRSNRARRAGLSTVPA